MTQKNVAPFLACILFSVTFAAGCKKAEDASPKAPPTEPASADKKVADSEVTGMANKMVNCPTSLKGTSTRIKKTANALLFTVVVDDASDVAELRKRAKHLEAVSGANSSPVKHSGKGTGSGELGKCPIALAKASAKAEDIENGVRVTLTPSDGDVDRLHKLANARMKAGGNGKKSGGHGGNGKGDGTGGGGGGGKTKK